MACKLSSYYIKYMFIKQNLENIYRRNTLPIIRLSTDKPSWTLLLYFLLTFLICVPTHTHTHKHTHTVRVIF